MECGGVCLGAHLLFVTLEYACKIYTAHVSPQILFGLIFRQKATFVASL